MEIAWTMEQFLGEDPGLSLGTIPMAARTRMVRNLRSPLGRVDRATSAALLKTPHNPEHRRPHNRTRLISGVEIQIAAVRSALSHIGQEEIEIRGALCFVDVDGPPLLRHQTLRDVFSSTDLAQRHSSPVGQDHSAPRRSNLKRERSNDAENESSAGERAGR